MKQLNERGIALVVAVFALTVIGALVAAAFFAGVQEHRMAGSGRRSQRNLVAAEARLSQVLRQWPEAAGSIQADLRDSLLLFGDSLVLRRVATDLYFVQDVRNALGMLVSLVSPCGDPHADGVEMNQSNCLDDSTLRIMSSPRLLRSRAWTNIF